jgi:hypothetical protein
MTVQTNRMTEPFFVADQQARQPSGSFAAIARQKTSRRNILIGEAWQALPLTID